MALKPFHLHMNRRELLATLAPLPLMGCGGGDGVPAATRPAPGAEAQGVDVPGPPDDAAPPLDTLVLGNTASESAHGLTEARTETIGGALGEPARRCLPRCSNPN